MKRAKQCVCAIIDVEGNTVHIGWGLAEDPTVALRQLPDGNSLSAGIADGTLTVKAILGNAVGLSARTTAQVVGLLRGRQ